LADKRIPIVATAIVRMQSEAIRNPLMVKAQANAGVPGAASNPASSASGNESHPVTPIHQDGNLFPNDSNQPENQNSSVCSQEK
jgi:hypothetical protein